MCFKRLATYTDEILNRFQAEARLRDLEQSPPQEEERSGDTEKDAQPYNHEEAVNHRLRDFAAFERRAKGNDVG